MLFDSNLTCVIIGQIFLDMGVGAQIVGSFIQGYNEIM